MEGRRAFEDRLNAALDRAHGDGTSVAVIVGELVGLLAVNARFGLDAGEEAVRLAAGRLEAAVADLGAAVARIGDAEFAVLVAPAADREHADRVMRRLERSFEPPFVVDGHEIALNLVMTASLGPGRRRTDADLLWRTAEASSHARSSILQRLVSEVRGRGQTLDEVGQSFADEGVARFGLQACEFTVGDRSWHAPDVLPDEPSTGQLPLRTEGRTIGTFTWWGPSPDDMDMAGVEVLLGHVASALDRAAAIDDADTRARTDPLTGLLNRDGLARELHDLDGAYAVGVIDLDHFKRINDEHGHDVGDVVLADLAALLQRGRNDDLIARWGGEEIVIVMPATTVDGAVARLQRLLEEARSFLRVGAVGEVTFSGGITASASDEPFADAVRRADEAMYRAKRGGRARVEVG